MSLVMKNKYSANVLIIHSGFGENYNPASEVLPIANRVREEQISSTDLGIPYITVTDSMNSIYTVGGTLFPATLSLGATFNIPLYEQVVGAIRDENIAVGTRWVLSPELDLAKEQHGGRIGEMYVWKLLSLFGIL